MTSKLVEGRPEMTARDGYEMKEWNCLLNQIIAETREHIRSQSDV